MNVFEKSVLVGCVIWPTGKQPTVSICDHDGLVLGQYDLKEPVMGAALSRLVPDGCAISFAHCEAFPLRGQIVCGAVGEFDTVVNPTRSVLGAEERLDRLEKGLMRRLQRVENENEVLKKREVADDPVIENPEPSVDASDDKAGKDGEQSDAEE